MPEQKKITVVIVPESKNNSCHSERSEEPPHFVFAFACSLPPKKNQPQKETPFTRGLTLLKIFRRRRWRRWRLRRRHTRLMHMRVVRMTLRRPVMEELRAHVAGRRSRPRLSESRGHSQQHRDGNLQLHEATFFPHIYDVRNAGPDSFSADCYTKTPISGYTTIGGRFKVSASQADLSH